MNQDFLNLRFYFAGIGKNLGEVLYEILIYWCLICFAKKNEAPEDLQDVKPFR